MITVTATMEVSISKDQVANALYQTIVDDYLEKDFDDAGCDLKTDFNGNTYLGGDMCLINSNKQCAALVDAYNVLKYGKALKLRPWHEDKVKTIVEVG